MEPGLFGGKWVRQNNAAAPSIFEDKNSSDTQTRRSALRIGALLARLVKGSRYFSGLVSATAAQPCSGPLVPTAGPTVAPRRERVWLKYKAEGKFKALPHTTQREKCPLKERLLREESPASGNGHGRLTPVQLGGSMPRAPGIHSTVEGAAPWQLHK